MTRMIQVGAASAYTAGYFTVLGGAVCESVWVHCAGYMLLSAVAAVHLIVVVRGHSDGQP